MELIDADYQKSRDELIDRFAINVAAKVGEMTPKQKFDGMFGYADMELSFLLVCTENFYGPNCRQFCTEQCECNKGFTGRFCETALHSTVGINTTTTAPTSTNSDTATASDTKPANVVSDVTSVIVGITFAVIVISVVLSSTIALTTFCIVKKVGKKKLGSANTVHENTDVTSNAASNSDHQNYPLHVHHKNIDVTSNIAYASSKRNHLGYPTQGHHENIDVTSNLAYASSHNNHLAYPTHGHHENIDVTSNLAYASSDNNHLGYPTHDGHHKNITYASSNSDHLYDYPIYLHRESIDVTSNTAYAATNSDHLYDYPIHVQHEVVARQSGTYENDFEPYPAKSHKPDPKESENAEDYPQHNCSTHYGSLNTDVVPKSMATKENSSPL